MSDKSGARDAEYSNDAFSKEFTSNGADNTNWVPNANALFFFNNSAVVVKVNNFPIFPGGTLPFGEMRKGVYDKPLNITFDGIDTGTLFCMVTIKSPRKTTEQ